MEPIKVTLTNFSLDEFRCKCCGMSNPDDKLLILVQALRYIYGKPIKINSAYRCPKHNSSVGGVENSQHTLGKAVDLSFPDTTLAELESIYKMICGLNMFSTVLFYKKSRFIHVDVRPRENPVYHEWAK